MYTAVVDLTTRALPSFYSRTPHSARELVTAIYSCYIAAIYASSKILPPTPWLNELE